MLPPTPPALTGLGARLPGRWLRSRGNSVLKAPEQPATSAHSKGNTGSREGEVQVAAVWRPESFAMSSADGLKILVKRQCREALVLMLWPEMTIATTQQTWLPRHCVVRPPANQARVRPTYAMAMQVGSGGSAGKDRLSGFDHKSVREQAHAATWSPGGHTASCRPDEVVHLLANSLS